MTEADARRAQILREIARRRANAENAPTSAIPARPVGSPPVLSLAQERLWVLGQMFPGRSTYNATMTMQLEGPLDARALRQALDTVVDRHEALRTTIRRDDAGRPAAVLLPVGVGARWEQHDLTAEPHTLDARLRQAAEAPFELARDTFLRGSLFRVADDEHTLILVTHHIASDGWSRGPLFAELTELYNAAVADRPPQVPRLDVQYGDYAAWQRTVLDSGAFEQTLDFWRGELAGADLVLDLPVDRPRPDERLFLGSRLGFEDAELGEQLRALGRQGAATAFMTYLALTASMLHAITGQTDFLLGSPSANRERPETAPLIGFFVDTIVVRVPLGGNPTFAEVLHRSRAAVLRSLGHPVPLDRLVDAMRPRRIPGVNPLFQVNYRMQGAPPPTPAFTGLTSSRKFTDTGVSRFDLAFGFVDAPGPLRGYFEFDSALFDESTVQAWADAVLALGRAVVADPGRSLDELTREVRALVAGRRPAPVTTAAPAAERPPIRRIRSGRAS